MSSAHEFNQAVCSMCYLVDGTTHLGHVESIIRYYTIWCGLLSLHFNR